MSYTLIQLHCLSAALSRKWTERAPTSWNNKNKMSDVVLWPMYFYTEAININKSLLKYLKEQERKKKRARPYPHTHTQALP